MKTMAVSRRRLGGRPCVSMRLNPSSFEGTSMTITEFPMPVLRNTNAPITSFDDAFRQTCSEMMSIMYAADGVGLAATQVGLAQRFFVYNPTANPQLSALERIVANPRIFEWSDEVVTEEEGCLSSRSDLCCGKVTRAKWIWVEYQDAFGKEKRAKLKDFEARIFQHEFDHIEGILHIDRLSVSDRAKIQPTLDQMAQEYGPGGALSPPDDVLANLQPPVRSGRMPRLASNTNAPAAKAPAPAPAGFGAAKKKPKKKKR